jgi:hypothetical protein
MYKIPNEQPVDPMSLNPAMPELLVAIVHRAIAKGQAQCYKSGEEMARAIRGCAGTCGDVDVSLWRGQG